MHLFEIRFHGRGGQGGVTGAKLLGNAAMLEKKHFQVFPHYGAERRGDDEDWEDEATGTWRFDV